MQKLLGLIGITIFMQLSACSYIYYNFWETFGVEKRDLLKRNVEGAESAQKESQEVFRSTLDKIKKLYGLEAGELEKIYQNLSADLDTAQESANRLRKRITDVESVAQDLFKEWRSEAESISNHKLRNQSLQHLANTEKKFEQLARSMHQVERSMDPVLTAMRDQVLFLKHNLNAMTLVSFKKEFTSIEDDIQDLIKKMNQSIQESDRFVDSLTT